MIISRLSTLDPLAQIRVSLDCMLCALGPQRGNLDGYYPAKFFELRHWYANKGQVC